MTIIIGLWQQLVTMCLHRYAGLALVLILLTAVGQRARCSLQPQPYERTPAMNVEQIKHDVIGDWVSLAPEIRPGSVKNPDGTLKPLYLTRAFTGKADDRFELTVDTFADPFSKVPLARMSIKGHMHWRGEHPIAAGAQKVDFVADEAYDVTPLLQGFADVLNQVASTGYAHWEVGQTQSVFGKSFVPFGLVEGHNFMEYDLVYVTHGMMFWGARNIDGRGFDTEENRPTNLQIPLVRK